jgi:hypothetical protein
MIHIREDGNPLQNGFNFYPLKSGIIGCVLKLGKHSFWCWYNTHAKRIRWMKRTFQS